MKSSQYVPILLTRRGERTALRELSAQTHERFTPLFVVPPIPFDYEQESPAESLTDYVATIPTDLHEARGSQSAFLDLSFLDEQDLMDNGRHPLSWIVEECASPLIPVVSLSSSNQMIEAARESIARDRNGSCLRLQASSWPDDADVAITTLLGRIGSERSECHLVIDLANEVEGIARTAIRAIITSLGNLSAWRSVVIAGTNMPKPLPEGQGVLEIERSEWLLYQDLVGSLSDELAFADYAIAHPDPVVDIDPRVMSINANLRYTTENSWLIAKGGPYKGRGGTSLGAAAVPPMLALLREHASFIRTGHCGLEEWVDAVLDHNASGSNPEAWRRMGTLHHVKFVTDQLASLHGV